MKVQETQEEGGGLNWVSICLKTFSFSSQIQDSCKLLFYNTIDD
jgi:hypothetical protein